MEMEQTITTNKISKTRIDEVDFENILFGDICSDHMFIADYADGQWQDLQIVPYEDINISPSTSGLHYGQSIFEGMKAYKDRDGNPQLFRPEMNQLRFNKSAARMAMPDVPKEIFMNGLLEILKLDHEWIPYDEGSSLYVRPFMFADNENIGVRPAAYFKFIIFTCPVGPYYQGPVKVTLSDKYTRAFSGGVGSAKAAGNYGATMLAVREANEQGYDQILWTDGVEHKYIHECGTMNVFFIIDGKVITPELNDVVLDGITRDSLIRLFKDRGIEVEQRAVSVDEIYEASQAGTLQEVFGTGTAANIAHITEIGYEKGDMILAAQNSESLSVQIAKELNDIKIGKIPDRHHWVQKL